MPVDTPLLTVELDISGCRSAVDLDRVGGALRCIRGVEKAESSAMDGRLTVSYRAGRVFPAQFERAVGAMGAHLDRIEPGDRFGSFSPRSH